MLTSKYIKEKIKQVDKEFGWKFAFQKNNFFDIGIFSSKNLDKVKEGFDSLPFYNGGLNSLYGCYAGFIQNFSNTEGYEHFIAYNVMPLWIEEFVEDFNNFFDNIKLEIIDKKEIPVTVTKGSTTVWGTYSKRTVPSFYLHKKSSWSTRDSYVKNVSIPLIKFSYSSDYEQLIVHHFNYSLGILLRMLSYSEKYHHMFRNKPINRMKYVLELNNSHKGGYRTFSHNRVTLEELKILDNIEEVNSKVQDIYKDRKGVLKQTDIFNVLTGKKPQVIKNY